MKRLRFATRPRAHRRLVYHKNAVAADAVVKQIAAAGGEALAVKADCSKVPEINAWSPR